MLIRELIGSMEVQAPVEGMTLLSDDSGFSKIADLAVKSVSLA